MLHSSALWASQIGSEARSWSFVGVLLHPYLWFFQALNPKNLKALLTAYFQIYAHAECCIEHGSVLQTEKTHVINDKFLERSSTTFYKRRWVGPPIPSLARRQFRWWVRVSKNSAWQSLMGGYLLSRGGGGRRVGLSPLNVIAARKRFRRRRLLTCHVFRKSRKPLALSCPLFFLLIPGTYHPVTSWYLRVFRESKFLKKRQYGFRRNARTFCAPYAYLQRQTSTGRMDDEQVSPQIPMAETPPKKQPSTRPAATGVRSWFSSMPIKFLLLVSRGTADWGAINSSLKQQQQCQHWSLHFKIVHKFCQEEPPPPPPPLIAPSQDCSQS